VLYLAVRSLDDYRGPASEHAARLEQAAQAFTIYFDETSQSHDCHDHLHRASGTSTLHWVNLQESRRFHEVFGFEVVQLRESVGYAFQGGSFDPPSSANRV
jgi:hypothetical protein